MWTCENCGTENQRHDEHCQNCDTWRSEQEDDHVSDTAARILDRLHQEALDENEERDWYRTGRIPCHDCGTTVRTKTLETLPPHNCIQRRRGKREPD